MGRASKRGEILDTAEALFSVQGFTATGINQITREAGVAAMTLYNNFDSKDALVTATLARRSRQLLNNIRTKSDKRRDPRAAILAVFDAIEDWVKEQLKSPVGFTGCLFLKAAHEHADVSSEVHVIAVGHKKALIALFERHLDDLRVENSFEVARTLHLLIDGAISQAQLFCDTKSVQRSRNVAALLLDTAGQNTT